MGDFLNKERISGFYEKSNQKINKVDKIIVPDVSL